MSDDETPREPRTLDGHQVEAELLADWRLLFSALHARFETGDFATGLALVQDIGRAAEEANHHPDVDLRYPHVDVRLTSHDAGGVTERDVAMARTVSNLADRAGARAATERLQVVELGLDSADFEAVKPFWAAVLGFEDNPSSDAELNDPDGRWPSVWFQQTDADGAGEAPPQRWHLDVRVPPEALDRRVQAALDAGGTLESDARKPTFVVLADAQGNRACLTTWLGRGGGGD